MSQLTKLKRLINEGRPVGDKQKVRQGCVAEVPDQKSASVTAVAFLPFYFFYFLKQKKTFV